MTNPSDLATELCDLLYADLEPHGKYILNKDDSRVRYFIPPELLMTLAWIGTNILVPILSGTAQTSMREMFGKRQGRSEVNAIELQKNVEDLGNLKREIEVSLAKLNSSRDPSEQNLMIARASLSEILVINGWPPDIASVDAEKAVQSFRDHLWRSNK